MPVVETRIIDAMRALISIAMLSAAAFAQDPQEFANPIWRTLVMGTHGMVAAEHPLEARAGLHVLEAGGNAFDAAVAIFYMTGVVEQHQAGLGGDAFILAYVAKQHRVVFINGQALRRSSPLWHVTKKRAAFLQAVCSQIPYLAQWARSTLPSKSMEHGSIPNC